jgi:FSR family fosmidomycin resistance protein-like MFS transporter
LDEAGAADVAQSETIVTAPSNDATQDSAAVDSHIAEVAYAAPQPAHPAPAAAPLAAGNEGMVLSILVSISFVHFLNDTMQSLIPAIYPILKTTFSLDFTQIGLITLTYQLAASLLQPLVGIYTDRHPKPYSLACGMAFTFVGLLLVSRAWNFPMLLFSVMLVGTGSSIFHPESSRVARMASGGRHGFAQSLFQVGGNIGTAIGPIMAAFIVLPHGQSSVAWFSVAALIGIAILIQVGGWYRRRELASAKRPAKPRVPHGLSRERVALSLAVLATLVFSKFFYTASFTSYYIFYLVDHFKLPVVNAQVYLFVYLIATAAGTLIGGPLGDRIGRKYVIWFSILGVFPFSFALPYADLTWTIILTIFIGLILSSAFSAIIVFGQELVPGNVGMISGIFFGAAFGLAGIGAAVFGEVADRTSIEFVFRMCSFLPLLGLLTILLPNLKQNTAVAVKRS